MLDDHVPVPVPVPVAVARVCIGDDDGHASNDLRLRRKCMLLLHSGSRRLITRRRLSHDNYENGS